jgi:hypothetical protein
LVKLFSKGKDYLTKDDFLRALYRPPPADKKSGGKK